MINRHAVRISVQSALVAVLIMSLGPLASCGGTNDRAVILDIKENFGGAGKYVGDFLVFRMYETGDADLDCVIDETSPLSESNITKKRRVAVSSQDAKEITDVILKLAASSYLEHYELSEKWTDVQQFTVITFSERGRTGKIGINGDLLNDVKMSGTVKLPQPLVDLVASVLRFRSRVCR